MTKFRIIVITLAAGCAALLTLTALPQSATADEQSQEKQVYRLVRVDGRVLTGTLIEDRPDAYVLGVSGGKIRMTVKKNQVRSIEPVAASEMQEEAPTVSDDEIQAILGSRDWYALSGELEDQSEQALGVLPVNNESVREMRDIAENDMGIKAQTLTTDHFVFVYTSEIEKARQLAARLESVYRWVVRFNQMMGVPTNKPDSKLEIYFFRTYDEYNAYQTLNGFDSMGAIGFYMRTNNRSAFFDMETWPPVANIKKQLEQMDHQQRRYWTNMIERQIEHMNLDVVQHEAAHHVHFNLGTFPKRGDVPRWMSEGLATMFEVPPSEAGASYGAINHPRLREFRMIYGENGERLPPMKLFVLNDGMFIGFPSYSLGWALNHYLSRQKREGYRKWMQFLADRENDWNIRLTASDRQKVFEDCFGPLNEQWTKDFVAYMKSIQLDRSVLPPDVF